MCGGHCGPDRLRQDMHPLVSQQTQNIPTTKEKRETINMTGRMYTLICKQSLNVQKKKNKEFLSEEVTFQRDFVKT